VLFFCEALYFQQEIDDGENIRQRSGYCYCKKFCTGENSKSNFVWPPPIFGDHQANVQI